MKFDYFFLPMSTNALWQKISGDQCLTCGPGSFSTPKFSGSKPRSDTSPAAQEMLVRISSMQIFSLIRKNSLLQILHWRMHPAAISSFPWKSSHHITAPSLHFSSSSQRQEKKNKKGRSWVCFYPGKIRTRPWHWDVCLTFQRNPETVTFPLGAKALPLHNYSRIGGVISDP